MNALYLSQVVRAGDLVFDVGANVGAKTSMFLEAGAHVVCFEPQPDCVAALQQKFQTNPKVRIAGCGLAAQPGNLEMSICSTDNTISSFSEKWKQGRSAEYSWEKKIVVPVTTLDEAIREYGRPDYVKIDVEGFECEVLNGLSQHVPLVSLKFATKMAGNTEACLQYLLSLGFRKFNAVVGECPGFAFENWVSAGEILDWIGNSTDSTLWGDVCARYEEDKTISGVRDIIPNLNLNDGTGAKQAIQQRTQTDKDEDRFLKEFVAKGLWIPGTALRLHLGCGEQHFPGYINIDYDSSHHAVMKSKADFCADIPQLDFPAGSLDEIRLHHVFEHFNRVTALALLIKWHRWLKVGGIVRIETPDIMGSAKLLVSDIPLKAKMGTVRHLAGDQADVWAYHVDHWFGERFQRTLTELGFSVVQVRESRWPQSPWLANVEVTAAKSQDREQSRQIEAADGLLWDSTVADQESGTWAVWRRQLREALLGKGTNPAEKTTPTQPAPETAADSIASLLGHNSKKPLADIHDFNQRQRDQWVQIKASEIPPGSKILDIGAGTCPYRSLFAHCQYTAHDFKKYKGQKLGDTTEYGRIDIESDIIKIPVPNGSFDAILCTEVLEHVPEPIAALKEMARILKPGGVILLTAPLGSALHQLPFHFYGGYTPEWYKHFGESFGLSVRELVPNGGFFKHLAQECARVSWTWNEHAALHGKDGDMIRMLFHEWLPRYLFRLDEEHSMPGFTTGYFVVMVKTSNEIEG